MVPVLVSVIFAVLLSTAHAGPIVLGTHGDTWEIVEKDPAELFRNRAEKNRKKLEKIFASLKKSTPLEIERKIADLPPIRERKTVLLDTTYTLDRDIYFPGRDGRWYYFPAGFIYNPLDYLKGFAGRKYLVVSPQREEEAAFAEEHASEVSTILLAGVPKRDLKIPKTAKISFLSREVAERLKLKGTPAFIEVTEKGLLIRYVPVKERPKK